MSRISKLLLALALATGVLVTAKAQVRKPAGVLQKTKAYRFNKIREDDGFADEWVNTLETLKKLDFETVLPGHGEAFTGKEKITAYQAYLRNIWTQVGQLKKQGLSADDAARKVVDMTAHKAAFPAITAPGVNAQWVTRMYEVMDMPKGSR